jgi:hypothetical protein
MLESLAAGSPILISDRTIWGDVHSTGAGWTVPLENPEVWTNLIRRCIEMGDREYLEMSAAARRFAESYLSRDDTERATSDVLEYAFGRSEECVVRAV